MDFSAGVHDVICTRKINIDRGTSCTPAEKSINVLLYNQSAQPYFQQAVRFFYICVALASCHLFLSKVANQFILFIYLFIYLFINLL